ncbi:DedA family protein [Mycobacterium sp. Z3061]|uniref:DedA family protein n=1 Tax=Mycobacterium sp. Z3061 TaxID=3073562 RepID=UPI002873E93F|nr:DedA family protein [Mycobacterium sp. Z3061]
MSAQLPGIFDTLAPTLDRYGYAAIVALVGLEGVGIPLPGQLILIAGGIYAASGHLTLLPVLIVGLLAAVGGDNAGYAIGRYGGRGLVLRFGPYVFLNRERLAKTERFFARRGHLVVSIGRFIDGLRQASGIAAGLARMDWRRYLAYNALGSAVWVSVWVFAGYLAGNHIASLYAAFQRYGIYLLATCAAVAFAVLAGLAMRRRQQA